jgi:hypothetical protein
MTRTFAMAPLLAIVLGGCSMLDVPMSAADACVAPARDYGGPVVGAFSTTVAAIRGLQPMNPQPQLWPDQPPGSDAVLCYIDAEIAKAPPPGPNGEIRDPYDRIAVGIVDGVATLVQAGYRDQLQIKAP